MIEKQPKNRKEIPYIPEGKQFEYVPENNEFMLQAKEVALRESLDKAHPTGSAIVIDGKVVSVGANGSEYHDMNGCERKRKNMPSGEGYELCEGCHPKNHSEQKAIAKTKEAGINISGAELYLWGHYWCCKSCWDAMLDSGVEKVILLDTADTDFDRNDPDNKIGKN